MHLSTSTSPKDAKCKAKPHDAMVLCDLWPSVLLGMHSSSPSHHHGNGHTIRWWHGDYLGSLGICVNMSGLHGYIQVYPISEGK